ncbi:STN domain-containing protein [Bradyrhizobium mercantei]|uniref:STN domain-containing protein n=1 Tax=Bradyrhizobium mercantei TaxID=1904807 RepID=UPI0009FABF0A|nr:secretin and TonB N-terminal domain-containing protein [Bradyrhizobium mercantei]
MAMVLRFPQAGRALRFWGMRTVIGLAALVAAGTPQVALTAEAVVEFDIPSQPLDTALSTYGAITRIQLLFDPGLTDGRRVNRLRGVFTPEAALQQLLSGTGLAARMIGEQGFTLVADEPPAGAAEVSPSVRRFNTFSASVQGALRAALCRDRETEPGSYRMLAQLWIGPSGTTDRVELVTSSGDDRRDALLLASIRGLAIGASPPGDLPQPVTLLVTPRGKTAGYCSQPSPSGRGRETRR